MLPEPSEVEPPILDSYTPMVQIIEPKGGSTAFVGIYISIFVLWLIYIDRERERERESCFRV